MRISTDNDFIYFEQATTEQKNKLMSYHNATKVKKGLRVPLNLWSLRELWKDFYTYRDELEPIGKHENTELQYLLGIRQLSKQVEPSDNLRKYQAEDVFYLKHKGRAGVFNEQRTGKTPTIIATIKELEIDNVLIVCPASLIYNWQREFEKWYPSIATKVVTGTPTKRESIYSEFALHKGVLIVSKDTLKADITNKIYMDNFEMFVVDEAHFLRNYKTAQSKAIFKVNSKRKYALTGTPTVKHPSDIFGILHFLYPRKFPSYWQFAERYFGVTENYMGYNEVGNIKEHRIDELQQMIGILSVQRKRKEVMSWLPDKERTTFYCEMDKKQRKAYNEMMEYFYIEDTNVDASSILTQLIRLRQICTEPSLLGLNVGSAKTDSLMDYLKETMNEPIVVMSMFTSYLKLLKVKLENEGFRVGTIHGEMSNQDKMDNATLFQSGQLDVLLCNTISAGTGFTLDRADTIIFMDKAWNPAENEQAEDRITPTTKEKVHKHHIISFVCSGTVDEKINAILDQKKSLTDIVNEGGLKAIKKLLL